MNNDQTTTIANLKQKVQQFIDERDWKQFHTPKNVAMCIAIEAAELMEHFQWCDLAQSQQDMHIKREEIEHEVADVAIYLIDFCLQNNIDLAQAMERKLALNDQKYPVEKCRGRSDKYTAYQKS